MPLPMPLVLLIYFLCHAYPCPCPCPCRVLYMRMHSAICAQPSLLETLPRSLLGLEFKDSNFACPVIKARVLEVPPHPLTPASLTLALSLEATC